MRSCLYEAQVMHRRLEPKQHRFHYNVFLFYIDLDEIPMLTEKLLLVSRNRFNVFSFRDTDHLQRPKENPDRTRSTKEHILDYLRENGVVLKEPRLMLLTNFCTFGYQFNPVSFYYCYDSEKLEGVVVEISNTFREMKPFMIGKENYKESRFRLNTKKYFYVSPFTDMDTEFDFNIAVPDEKMNIKIDTLGSDSRKIIITALTGRRRELTNARLFRYALRFPLITLQVISLIHWNAFRLWLKKIPYHKKKSDLDLQRGVYNPYRD